jgi:molecular chaperone GrpE
MAGHEERHGKQGAEIPVQIRVTDRRPHFEAESAGEAPSPEAPAPRYPSYVAELEARARAAEEKLAQAVDLLRRREGEADDFRARLRREMEKRSRAQVEAFLRELLEVVDSLDRGVAAAAAETDPASLRQGLIQVRDQFFSFLARQGVEPMSLAGTDYDPHSAEAVAVVPVEEEKDDNRIVEEVRRGFTFDGQTLRPAQVRVARRIGPAASAD